MRNLNMVCNDLLNIIGELIYAIDAENLSYSSVNSNRRQLITEKQSEKNALCEIYWSLCKEFKECPPEQRLKGEQKSKLDEKLHLLEEALHINKVFIDAQDEAQKIMKRAFIEGMQKDSSTQSSYTSQGRKNKNMSSFINKKY
jgi:hypothetical protein